MVESIESMLSGAFQRIGGVECINCPEGQEIPGTVHPKPMVFMITPPDEPNHIVATATIKDSCAESWIDAAGKLVDQFRRAVAASNAPSTAFRPLPPMGFGGVPAYRMARIDGIPVRLITAYSMMQQGWIVSIDAWHETTTEKSEGYKYERML